jgi:hypothetical protein
LEWYSSCHSETVEELLHWPSRRFEAFYKSAQKRALVESLNGRKDAMITALWCNSNYDGDGEGKDPRKEAIEDIEEKYQNAIDLITGKAKPEEEVEIDYSNPFFGKARESRAKWDADIEMPHNSEDLARIQEYSKDIDQG